MRLIFILSCFSFFLFSCGNQGTKNNSDSITQVDLFREDVLDLQRAGMFRKISDHKLDSLIGLYRRDSLNGLKEMLVQSGDMLHMRVHLNGRPATEVLAKVCDTIGMRYPDLKCDEVQTEVILHEDKNKRNDTDWIVLRLRFGDTWYARKLYYFNDWPVDELLYKIYNMRMADAGIPERLCLVEFSCKNCHKEDSDFLGDNDPDRIGYLRLNKTQADSLLAIENLRIEPDDEFSIFTSAKMQETISNFEKTGLIGKNDEKWYAGIRKDILLNSAHDMGDIYDFLDTLFCELNLSGENDYSPYYEALSRMERISRGNFSPAGIYDSEINPSLRTVRFTLKGKVYEKDYELHEGIFDPSVVDDVNKALQEQKIPGAFYTVLTKTQRIRLVYIEDKNFEQAMKSGFFTELTKGASEEIKTLYQESQTVI